LKLAFPAVESRVYVCRFPGLVREPFHNPPKVADIPGGGGNAIATALLVAVTAVTKCVRERGRAVQPVNDVHSLPASGS